MQFHGAPTSGGRGLGVDGVSDFTRAAFRLDNEKVQLCAYCLMRFRALPTNLVGRTTSAANGEGAILPKLLIFPAPWTKPMQRNDPGRSAPILGLIRMAPAA